MIPFSNFLLKGSSRQPTSISIRRVTPSSKPESAVATPTLTQNVVSKSVSADKFVCSQSSVNPQSHNTNEAITKELEKLAQTYKSSNDRWRAHGYEKAIAAIKRYPKPILTHEDAAKIPGVGAKMADKIVEILESGSLQKVSEICEGEKAQVIDLFNRVWGAGPSTAESWYQQGHRTIEDLRLKANLNRHQKVGVDLFNDLDERMDRNEASEIEEFVRNTATSMAPGLEVIACGSFRRGKATCGDLDILITHVNDDIIGGNFFDQLISKLRDSGFLTHDLTISRDGNQRKYLGVCKLLQPAVSKHRRLDIIVVPYSERAPSLLYFTGSAHFNRSMRLLASKMGMSLSEHGLRAGVVRSAGSGGKERLNVGTLLDTPTEETVFELLKLPYRQPHERDH